MVDEIEPAEPAAGPSTLPTPPTPPTPFESLTRPPFRPTTLTPSDACLLSTAQHHYISTFSHPVHFTRANFFSALKDLTLHPERNSSLILRADPLPAREPTDDEEVFQAGLRRHEEIRVRLMPKQVKRDGKLDQRVPFYEDDLGRGIVLMIPEVEEAGDVPFYHPPVRKLAFIYEPIKQPELGHQQLVEETPMRGVLSIAYLPFSTSDDAAPHSESVQSATIVDHYSTPPMPSFLGGRPVKSPRKRSPLAASPLGSSSNEPIKPPAVVLEPVSSLPAALKTKSQAEIAVRTVRTCKLLLERVYKHAYGNMVGYQKRVIHDTVVNRETFQDLYLILKDRHRHLDSRVVNPRGSKIEDVKRHVWKISDASLPSDPSLPADVSAWGSQDIAIATFLMLLWRDMYPSCQASANGDEEARDWDTWGRPSAGFVDLGCGNGLLVHVLTSEGYAGKGFELRARKTWPGYPPKTREALVEYPISFPDWFPSTLDEWTTGDWEGKDGCPIQEGCFIIGNHADEITPWIPLLSLLPSRPAPFISLPCCLHTLDGPFTSNIFTPPAHPKSPTGGFDQGLEEGQSRYKAYLMWLGWCGLQCGWQWEKEPLRIPSTKGWAIIGRHRWASDETAQESREWALEQVNGTVISLALCVGESGTFKFVGGVDVFNLSGDPDAARAVVFG